MIGNKRGLKLKKNNVKCIYAIPGLGTTEELFQNNPIITWGYTSLSAPYTWKTSAGTIVKAFKGTHSRVLTGFKGEKENPIGFYISDPLSGKKNEYWSTAKLVAHMNAVPGVTNQIVVVK